ncbi:MAG: DUF58 domain-containing protein [Candidatus Nanohaloarchaea archaeon]
MKEEDFISQKQLRDQLDVEVKRVSELFRFIMKYKKQFQPSGVEFSGLRQYLPSDDASRIDWKNSAGKPDMYVKQYDEELDMDVYIILDASNTMTFGTADKLKSEYAALVTSSLAYASIDAGLNVGLGIYGKGDKYIMTPRGSMDQYQRVLDEVTKQSHYGGTFNLESALNDAIGQIKENTSIFIVSDFLENEGDWKSKMTLANHKFRHVMSVIIRDLRDYKMPKSGNMHFESPDGSQTVTVNTHKFAEKFNEQAAKDEEALMDKLTSSGCSYLKIDTRDDFSGKFAEYFDSEGEGSW